MSELAALEQQNAQLTFLQDQAQLVASDRTYRQARIQSIRSWTGFVSKLYTLFAVFFVLVLAFTRPANASIANTAVRAVLALLALVFPWCIRGLAASAVASADSIRGFARSRANQYRLATGTA